MTLSVLITPNILFILECTEICHDKRNTLYIPLWVLKICYAPHKMIIFVHLVWLLSSVPQSEAK